MLSALSTACELVQCAVKIFSLACEYRASVSSKDGGPILAAATDGERVGRFYLVGLQTALQIVQAHPELLAASKPLTLDASSSSNIQSPVSGIQLSEMQYADMIAVLASDAQALQSLTVECGSIKSSAILVNVLLKRGDKVRDVVAQMEKHMQRVSAFILVLEARVRLLDAQRAVDPVLAALSLSLDPSRHARSFWQAVADKRSEIAFTEFCGAYGRWLATHVRMSDMFEEPWLQQQEDLCKSITESGLTVERLLAAKCPVLHDSKEGEQILGLLLRDTLLPNTSPSIANEHARVSIDAFGKFVSRFGPMTLSFRRVCSLFTATGQRIAAFRPRDERSLVEAELNVARTEELKLAKTESMPVSEFGARYHSGVLRFPALGKQTEHLIWSFISQHDHMKHVAMENKGAAGYAYSFPSQINATLRYATPAEFIRVESGRMDVADTRDGWLYWLLPRIKEGAKYDNDANSYEEDAMNAARAEHLKRLGMARINPNQHHDQMETATATARTASTSSSPALLTSKSGYE